MTSSKIIVVSNDKYDIKKARNWADSNGFQVLVSNSENFENALPTGASTVSKIKEPNNLVSFPERPSTDILKLADVTKFALESALKKTGGNIMATSKALGMGRATVYRKIKIYNIDKSLFRRDKIGIKKAA